MVSIYERGRWCRARSKQSLKQQRLWFLKEVKVFLIPVSAQRDKGISSARHDDAQVERLVDSKRPCARRVDRIRMFLWLQLHQKTVHVIKPSKTWDEIAPRILLPQSCFLILNKRHLRENEVFRGRIYREFEIKLLWQMYEVGHFYLFHLLHHDLALKRTLQLE